MIPTNCTTWMLEGDLPGLTTPLAMMPMGDRNRFMRENKTDMGPTVERKGNIAVVRLDGVAVRRTDYFEAYYNGYSTENLEQLIRTLGEDEEVAGIVLWIDSPGGEAQGVDQAAKAIAEVAKMKPIVAQVQGSAHSAAYYLAAGATKIVLHSEDRVGSIGVMARVLDFSEAYKNAGIEPYTSATGPLKGMGVQGDKLTDVQKEHIDHHVGNLFVDFKSHVATGRNLSPEAVDALATGGIYNAKESIENGLADSIGGLDETLSTLRAELSNQDTNQPKPTEGAQTVSTEPKPTAKTEPATTPTAEASFGEIKACLPTASADFLVDCLEKKLTVEQSRNAWMEKQEEDNKALQVKLAESEKRAETAAAGGLGVDDQLTAEGGKGDSEASGSTFEARVDALTAKGMSCAESVGKAVAESPENHRAYVEAYQEQVA